MALNIYPSGYTTNGYVSAFGFVAPLGLPVRAPGKVIPPVAATAPATPSTPPATASDAQATVSWTRPADGGTVIKGYSIQVYLSGSLVNTVSVGVVTSTIVTGLTNGGSYKFKVAALSQYGLGAYSAFSSTVTPLAPTAPYVTLGSGNGVVMSSETGNSWTSRTMPLATSYAVAYGGDRFVVTGNATAGTAYSLDGRTWSLGGNMPTSSAWNHICYGDKFVAVGSSNKVAYSTDNGATWTAATIPGTSVSWLAVTYGLGIYTAVSNSSARAAWSSDGITWNTGTLAAGSQTNRGSIAFDGSGKFVVGGASATSANAIRYSTDGKNWSSTTSGVTGAQSWMSIAYGNGTFLAVSQTIVSMVSSDGINWTQQAFPTGVTPYGVTYRNGLFVMTPSSGGTNTAATSATGLTGSWTTNTVPVSSQWAMVTGP